MKTRLGRDIGHGEAVALYQKLLRRSLGIVSDFKFSQDNVDIFLFFSPPGREVRVRKAYPGPWEFLTQSQGHLGQKMAAAVRDLFERGYEQVVLVGTDVADLMVSDLRDAFRSLNKRVAVLGPAQDGGFYLIGLTFPVEAIFNFDSWSNSFIFERTLKCLDDSGLDVKILSERRDVDQRRDLAYIEDQSFFKDCISIIIPFSGRVIQLAPLIDSLEAQLWPGDEIIIVKGHGLPEWVTEDITPYTRLVLAPRGRGIQLNTGARLGEGDLFWFLHADTEPPPNFGYHIRKLSRASDTALGCFELNYGSSRPSLELVARCANLRTRYLKLPYGDQGLFCHREIFEKAGGFKKQFLFEDVDFVRACKRLGRIMVIPQPVRSSPRRYLMKGILRTLCTNHLLLLLYYLGVSDRRLYSLYYGGDCVKGQGD